VHLHDTYFVVAHFHYVMMGSAMIAFFAGLHYWWPKITGRMYNEVLARITALLVFIGFNVTFFPQFVMGSQGMPRRYADYSQMPQFTPYHVMSSIGGFVMAIAFVLMAVYLIHSIFRGARAAANPWGGATLEWTCASPPPHDNFAVTPVAGDPYDYRGLRWDASIGGYLRDASGGAPSVGH
jgi:cytochrome c oxidase subunit 1